MSQNKLLPKTKVFYISLSEVNILEPARINIEMVGEKAFGLSTLPFNWTLPYIVLGKDIYENYKQEKLTNQLLDQVVYNLLATFENAGIDKKSDIIIRSSAIEENISNRGDYYSSSGSVKDIKNIILECFLLHKNDETVCNNIISFIVQPYITVHVEKGHLSNERRCYKDKRDWLCAIEKEVGEEELISINIRRWRNDIDPSNYINEQLKCNKSEQLNKVLKIVALWAYEERARVHFEWVWDGTNVYLVQADEEIENKNKGINPRLACNGYTEIKSFEPKCLKQLKHCSSSNKYNKLKNVLLYESLEISTQKLFILDDMGIIKNIANNKYCDELLKDLDILTKNILIVRMDIPNSEDQSRRQLLPRTECQNDLEIVKSWLTDQANKHLKEYNEFAFIFHNFIPSISSAFVYVEPQNPIVKIESLWGLPEGLYYNNHDKYSVDTLQKNITKINYKKIAVHETINYKPFFIGPNSSGSWVRQNTMIPFDYQGSIESKDWVRDIAIKSRKICENLNESVSIMWFIGIPENISKAQVIPWFHEKYKYDVKQNQYGFKAKTVFDKIFTINTYDDLQHIKSTVQKSKAILFLKFHPTEDRMLRNKDIINEIAQFCIENDATIVLEGGQLSHVYYQFNKKGVNIHTVNTFGQLKKTEIKFDKLVRDGIVDKIKAGGEYVDYGILEKEVFNIELRKKLIEEAFEVLESKSNDEIIEELADVSQVIISLSNLMNIPMEKIEEVRQKKNMKVGGFEKGLVLRETKTFEHSEKTLPLAKDLPDTEKKLNMLQQKVKRNIDNREDSKINSTLLNLKIPVVLEKWRTDFKDVRKLQLGKEQIDVKINGKRKRSILDLDIEIISKKEPEQISIFDINK